MYIVQLSYYIFSYVLLLYYKTKTKIFFSYHYYSKSDYSKLFKNGEMWYITSRFEIAIDVKKKIVGHV